MSIGSSLEYKNPMNKYKHFPPMNRLPYPGSRFTFVIAEMSIIVDRFDVCIFLQMNCVIIQHEYMAGIYAREGEVEVPLGMLLRWFIDVFIYVENEYAPSPENWII